MARKNYYKPYKRTYAPRKRWASNLLQGDLGGSGPGDSVVLVSNSSQTATPTPIIVKAGNFKIQGDVNVFNSSAGLSFPVCNMFLLYIPEGISGSNSDLNAAIQQHPEWIMGWTCVDMPFAGTTEGTTTRAAGNKFSISNRLKRNLNSGDKIYLFAQYGSGYSCNVHYTAQWFTCAN